MAGDSTAAATTATNAVKRAGRRVGTWLLGLVLAAALVYAGYTWFALSWDYSTGERAGLVQKFSRRGVLCKTWEGELAMYVVAGVQPEVWPFSVRDPKVAEQLKATVGRRVQLHYSEHPPFHRCFGDTRYFVDGLVPLDGPDPAVAPVGNAAAAQAIPATH